jgi:hypothetical protein
LSRADATANAAALDLCRRAWIPDQNIEVRAKYLALADKASRTLALLSEALDRHRGRGQQRILKPVDTSGRAGGSRLLRRRFGRRFY